jgi:predicted RNA-binding protein YlxR (DUF448 family)
LTQALAITDTPIATGAGRGKRRDSERRCIVTGAVGAPERLVRFVVGPASLGEGGAVVPDIDERLPGRGMWVTAERDVLERAMAKGAFARAAGQRVTVDPDLVGRVETLLALRVIALLGLARRAGAAVAGYEKVRAALAGPKVALVLEARDAGTDARKRLVGAIGSRTVLRMLDGAELAAAFGRDMFAHVAVLFEAGARGRLAAEIERECRRLSGFRPDAAGAMIDRDMDGR